MLHRFINRSLINRNFTKKQYSYITRYFGSSGSNKPVGGVVHFPLADIGEGITEVQIVQWFVENGSKIQEFDKLCEVMSDKANVEIPSPHDGEVLELLWKVGDMAKVGEPLLKIKVEGGEEEAAADVVENVQTTQTKSPSTSPKTSIESHSTQANSNKVQTTPAVRRIAQENNVDLTLVQPTGPGGRILKEDVQNYLKHGSSSVVTPTPSIPTSQSTTPVPTTPTMMPTQKPISYSAPTPSPQDKIIPIIGVKTFMVKKMNEANQVPQFGYGDEICMDKLIEFRNQINKNVQSQFNIKLSYLPFILKATSLALLEYPILNSHVNSECTEILQKKSHNIGIAVDSSQGLVVPNIKDCQDKSVLEIAQDINKVVERVRDNKVTKEDITCGTFTLSNIGALGGTVCRPIVFVPEVCIGALGKTQVLPMYNDNMEVVPKSMMHASWSADHRIIDGATVARFSNTWKQYIENPQSMLLHLK